MLEPGAMHTLAAAVSRVRGSGYVGGIEVLPFGILVFVDGMLARRPG